MAIMRKPKGIIIHHSLTKDGRTLDWDAIRRYHINVNGWDDVGYHAGVERFNNQLVCKAGRSIAKTGAHTIGHNDYIGICIVGNFDETVPDDQLLRYTACVVAGFLRTYSYLTLEDVHRHHEYATKSCPGKLFPWKKFLDFVKQAI